MNIQCVASRFFGDQISRIEDGLISLDHHILSENNATVIPDCIFCNDSEHYNQAINIYYKFNKTPKLILNVLDICYWCHNFDDIISDFKHILPQADKITCISKAVQKQIKDYLNLGSEIIYTPVKNVYLDSNIDKDILFLYVGRANDIRKNFKLIKDTFRNCNINQENLIVVGSENPNYGQYLGIVSDSKLNELYNRSNFLLLPSFFEGTGLSALEASICGCVPIVCSDNPVSKEFYPDRFIAEPTIEGYSNKLFELINDYNNSRNLALQYAQKYSIQFSPKQIAQNIIDIFHKL